MAHERLSHERLSQDTITFGKYKNLTLNHLLRDRKYCAWILKQDWFQNQYEYLYNRVKEYNPIQYFLKQNNQSQITPESTIDEFLELYPYFHLCPTKDLEIKLSENDKICYKYYRAVLRKIANKIQTKQTFAIKAPTSWLQQFEQDTSLSRDIFKEFLSAHDLPNIPYIIEDVKKQAGIDYKGAKSYLIAKENSLKQEQFWEKILKKKYGQDIATQYKYGNCIFDFLHIKDGVIYECKIGIKDFNVDQYRKYLVALEKYKVVYLIDRDCIIDILAQKVITTDLDKYSEYLGSIAGMKKSNQFDKLIQNFQIIEINKISDFFSS